MGMIRFITYNSKTPSDVRLKEFMWYVEFNDGKQPKFLATEHLQVDEVRTDFVQMYSLLCAADLNLLEGLRC